MSYAEVFIWPGGSVTVELRLDIDQYLAGLVRVDEAVRMMALRVAASSSAAGRFAASWGDVPAHAFMPDFDLACTVAGCDLTAEQH